MTGINTELEIQAHALVDRVIDNARKRIVTDLGDTSESLSRPLSEIKTYDSLLYRETEEYEIPKIEWMTIEEFDIDLGTKKLDEFVKVSISFNYYILITRSTGENAVIPAV